MNLNNNNLLSLIAIAASMFFAGAFINGERVRGKEAREELKEIKAEQAAIQERITNLYAKAVEKETEILQLVDSSYQVLEVLTEKKRIREQELQQIQQNLQQKRQSIATKVGEINDLYREFTFKTD